MTPILAALVLLLLVTLGYVARCAASPFGPCRKCDGLGHQLKADRRGRLKRGKDCRRCHATGLRLRVGRRAWNALTGARRAADN